MGQDERVHTARTVNVAQGMFTEDGLVASGFVFLEHLRHQIEWSRATFGPGDRTEGVVDHIRKELEEVLANPHLSEWVDVIILALDGAWRSGASPEQIIAAIVAKQKTNEARKWPDWRTAPPGVAIEHREREEGEYYVHRNAGGAVFVKEAAFFASQGGLVEEWGKGWIKVRATSIEHARTVGDQTLPATT